MSKTLKRILFATATLLVFLSFACLAWAESAGSVNAPPNYEELITTRPGDTGTPPADYVSVPSPPETYQIPRAGEPGIQSFETPTALLIQDYYPWMRNSNEQVLQEFGVSYDRINSFQLSEWDLSGYKFIMYASDQPISYYLRINANLSKISEYVANGGLLLAHCCDWGWNSGVWWTTDILPGNVPHSDVYTLWQRIHIEDLSHPVVDGLTDAALSFWNYSTHGYFPDLPAGGMIIATITYLEIPRPTYIEYPYGNGKVLATMQTVEWGYGDWGTYNWFVNAPELLRNEIRYALAYQQGVIVSAVLDKREFDPSGDHEGEDLSRCAVTVTLSEPAYVSIDIIGPGGELTTSLPARMVDAATPESFTWAGDRYAPNHQIVYEGSYTLVIRARSGPSPDAPLLGETSRWVRVTWHMGDE